MLLFGVLEWCSEPFKFAPGVNISKNPSMVSSNVHARCECSLNLPNNHEMTEDFLFCVLKSQSVFVQYLI